MLYFVTLSMQSSVSHNGHQAGRELLEEEWVQEGQGQASGNCGATGVHTATWVGKSDESNEVRSLGASRARRNVSCPCVLAARGGVWFVGWVTCFPSRAHRILSLSMTG